MREVILSEAEREAIEVLAGHIVEPGERCPTCHRRVNKPRQASSPNTKKVAAELPAERADALNEGLDNLQEYVGADSKAYPKGSLLEALLGLGAQRREELREWFEGRE